MSFLMCLNVMARKFVSMCANLYHSRSMENFLTYAARRFTPCCIQHQRSCSLTNCSGRGEAAETAHKIMSRGQVPMSTSGTLNQHWAL